MCNSHFNVSKARDGVWHWCTSLFPILQDDIGSVVSQVQKQLAFVLLSAFEVLHSYLATSLEAYSCLGGK